MIFAVTEIPNTVFGLMALIITVLGTSVGILFRMVTQLSKDRLTDKDAANEKYIAVIEKQGAVINDFSQTSKLLLAKLPDGGKS